MWSETGQHEYNYDHNIETICAEVVDFMDRLAIKRGHFLGESASGQIGHALAALITPRENPTSVPDHLLNCDPFTRSPQALSQAAKTSPRQSLEYLDWWLSEMEKSSAEGLAGYAAFLSNLNTGIFMSENKSVLFSF